MELSFLGLAVLSACFLTSVFVARNKSEVVSFGLMSFISVASFSTVVSLLIGPAALKITAIALSLVIFIAGLLYSLFSKTWPSAKQIFFGFSLSAGSFALDALTRAFGLASSAFTDGQTIVALSQGFQQGEFDPLTGSHAMKRGFGLPAMHALGPNLEYFAGLMPVFFCAALWMTWQLSISVAKNRFQAASVFLVIGLLSLSTEAVARHAYLVNTHAIAWLIFAIGLNYLVLASKRRLESSEIFGLIVMSAAIGFLRIDYIILFAPLTLGIALVLANYRKILSWLFIVAQGLSAAIWTSVGVRDFPIFGDLGPIFLLLASALVGGIVLWIHNQFKFRFETLGKIFFTWLAAGILVFVFISADFSEALRDLFTNLFLGEGLWGATIMFLLIVVAYTYIFTQQQTSQTLRVILNVFLLSLSAYLASKYLDGSSTGKGLPNLIRVGFGDSFNRTLVSWIPFLVFPLARFFEKLPLKR
ncbi:MAG: hypothetical protein RIS51_485 [Actinomycetota bacterium]|jgi:hypothetical protein